MGCNVSTVCLSNESASNPEPDGTKSMERTVLVAHMSFSPTIMEYGVLHLIGQVFRMRQILYGILKLYRGQNVSMNDGRVTCVFEESRDAVWAALEIKRAMKLYNRSNFKNPVFHLPLLGIGIDCGINIVEDPDSGAAVGVAVDTAVLLSQRMANRSDVLVSGRVSRKLADTSVADLLNFTKEVFLDTGWLPLTYYKVTGDLPEYKIKVISDMDGMRKYRIRNKEFYEDVSKWYDLGASLPVNSVAVPLQERPADSDGSTSPAESPHARTVPFTVLPPIEEKEEEEEEEREEEEEEEGKEKEKEKEKEPDIAESEEKDSLEKDGEYNGPQLSVTGRTLSEPMPESAEREADPSTRADSPNIPGKSEEQQVTNSPDDSGSTYDTDDGTESYSQSEKGEDVAEEISGSEVESQIEKFIEEKERISLPYLLPKETTVVLCRFVWEDTTRLYGPNHRLRVESLSAELLYHSCERWRGRLVEPMLCVFEDPSDALASAVEIRDAIDEHNTVQEDESNFIPLRGVAVDMGQILEVPATDVQWGVPITAAGLLAEDAARQGDLLLTDAVVEATKINARFRELVHSWRDLDFTRARAVGPGCWAVTGNLFDVEALYT